MTSSLANKARIRFIWVAHCRCVNISRVLFAHITIWFVNALALKSFLVSRTEDSNTKNNNSRALNDFAARCELIFTNRSARKNTKFIEKMCLCVTDTRAFSDDFSRIDELHTACARRYHCSLSSLFDEKLISLTPVTTITMFLSRAMYRKTIQLLQWNCVRSQ